MPRFFEGDFGQSDEDRALYMLVLFMWSLQEWKGGAQVAKERLAAGRGLFLKEKTMDECTPDVKARLTLMGHAEEEVAPRLTVMEHAEEDAAEEVTQPPSKQQRTDAGE